ncbi:MAG: serine hydrolase [Bacteroidota bacterium]|nr:serine hydrolase [Bacteroidota bacterium]
MPSRFAFPAMAMAFLPAITALLLAPARTTAQQAPQPPQKDDPAFLLKLLRQQASPFLNNILDKPDSFRYQVIYTRIDRDANNVPHFQDYSLRLDPLEYFNPASTVKMPLAFLALEKMDRLARYGIDKFTPMLTDSAYSGQTAVSRDTSSADGLPSIANYIKKIFLVSDNDAYNRLYEFLGQETINKRLWEMGYPDIRITRRFVPMNEDQNKHTNPVRFVKDGKLLYAQPPATANLDFDFRRQVLIGNAHMDSHDSLIRTPMDFTRHNNVPLRDLQMILRSVLFPASVPPRQRFHLTPDDERFLFRYMSELPSESVHPHYDSAEYFDSYAKFWMFKAGRRPIPPYIRIFNKPGWSYGFLTDIAYIVDFKNKVEFMLAGVIYVNSDGVLNDDKYDYDQVGYPFFSELGEIIYRYERQRPRRYSPDLNRFKLTYDR